MSPAIRSFLKKARRSTIFKSPIASWSACGGRKWPKCCDNLYAPFLRTEKPFLVMSPESAEMTKYVANALLATKISFINEMANLCERMQADIDDVRRGIGHDSRIGFSFLFPGVGYGGSCFPKDVQALSSMAREHGIEPRILDAVHEVNNRQKARAGRKNRAAFRRQAAKAKRSPSGAWPSNRAPTIFATPRRWC